MPLKAKIANSVFTRHMAGAPHAIKELPGDEPNDVLFNSNYGARIIELNRPAKLNSLNGSMARKIAPRLQEWEKSQLANIIIIKGAGEKAFCAGGDVAALALENQKGPEGKRKSVEYFGLEYQLDHLVATYRKPYVAFMDGITMGGGVGLSVHAPFRIATERTMFAMPETTIGFFPDVGGSFFLSRLDGEVGTYLALTSARLHGVHTMYAGIATHYIHSSSLPDLESRLAELTFEDRMGTQERYEIVNDTIEEFMTGLPSEGYVLSGETREAIDRCFRFNTVDNILAALGRENSEWAQQTLETLHQRSPTSVRVALRALREGKKWTISETFQREYFIAARFMEHHDFVEGVDARLIRKSKDSPNWIPATLEQCDETVTEEFFDVREEHGERLRLLTDGRDYLGYPHDWIGLPSENAITQQVARPAPATAQDVIRYFDEVYQGKKGVKAKVNDVLQRKATVNEMGFIKLK